jgi:hypothetical protein
VAVELVPKQSPLPLRYYSIHPTLLMVYISHTPYRTTAVVLTVGNAGLMC